MNLFGEVNQKRGCHPLVYAPLFFFNFLSHPQVKGKISKRAINYRLIILFHFISHSE